MFPERNFSGVVDAGKEASDLKAGDRVIAIGLGGFAEEAVAGVARTTPLPAAKDFDVVAVLIRTYGTSLRGLKDCGHLVAGETLLALGAAGGSASPRWRSAAPWAPASSPLPPATRSLPSAATTRR